MRFKQTVLLIMVLTTITLNAAYASVNEDLNSYFNGLGFSSNVSAPGAYHGQQAGFYTGGSVFMRSKTRDVQLVQIELPSFKSGCSGIDVYTGGFSFIDSKQIKPLLQNIMNNSASYAFTLAMETTAPALANVMKYWNDFASKVNQANINSCEMAEGLVGGMWPRVRGAQQRVCQDIGSNSNGMFTDWAQAKQGCGTGDEFTTTMDKARNDPRYKNLVFDSGNITWKAIKQNHLFGADEELAQFFMSLSGTVILSKEGSSDDAPVQFSPALPSLMNKERNNLIKALLEGGEVNIYRCDTFDENGCLHPQPGKIHIAKEQAFGARIRKLLDDMVEKIINDKALTKEEIGLLQSTSLPIYKMLNVQSAFAKDRNILDVSSYSDAIASDILFQYLEQSIQIIRNHVAASQYSEAIIAELRPNIDQELAQLRELQKTAYSRMAISIQLIQQTQAIERMLAGDLSTDLANSLSWAKGMK